jgi:hypothetical protein
MILAVSNIYLTKTKRTQKWNVRHWKENFKQIFAACGGSDVTQTMATRSASVDMAVKWRLNPRERFVCSSSISQNLWPLFIGIFWWSSTKTLHLWINPLSRVESAFYYHVKSCTLSDHSWSCLTLPSCYKTLFFKFFQLCISFISVCRLVFVHKYLKPLRSIVFTLYIGCVY